MSNTLLAAYLHVAPTLLAFVAGVVATLWWTGQYDVTIEKLSPRAQEERARSRSGSIDGLKSSIKPPNKWLAVGAVVVGIMCMPSLEFMHPYIVTVSHPIYMALTRNQAIVRWNTRRNIGHSATTEAIRIVRETAVPASARGDASHKYRDDMSIENLHGPQWLVERGLIPDTLGRAMASQDPAVRDPAVKKCLKRVLGTLANPPKLEDCVIVDVVNLPGAYFPTIHTDVEFAAFTSPAGFQVWTLVENAHPLGYGNMFLYEHPGMPEPLPYVLQLTATGEGDKSGEGFIRVSEHTAVTAGLGVKPINMTGFRDDLRIDQGRSTYLDFEAGDTLVMNTQVPHCSDTSRLEGYHRVAVNFRVVVRDPDGGLPHSGSKMYMHGHHDYRNGKLYNVGMFDMA